MPRPLLSADAEGDASENAPKDMSEADIDKIKEDLARDFQSHLNGLSAVFNQLLGQHDLHFDKDGNGLADSFESAPAEKRKDSKFKKNPKELLALRETVRQSIPESPRLSAGCRSQQELENQYKRLDIENNGKLSCSDLERVVKKFGNDWAVEDMFSLVSATLEVKSQLRRATSSKKQSFKNRSRAEVGLSGSMVDFETFKVLAIEDSAITDTFTWEQQSDAKILRDALQAEQTWSRYQDDGHLRGQTTFELKPEISSLQRKVHAFFEIVPPLVIVVNVIVVGLSVDMQKDDPSNPVWQVLEIVFLTFYFFEAVGKLAVFGCRWYFLGEDHWWNLFDFICLLLSLADLVIYIYVEISQVENPFNLQTLMLVKMLRLARLARLIRTLRFAIFYELKLMVLGVISGMRVLAWALVLLALLIYAAAIATTSMFGGDERVPEMRSLSRSWFTLFRCFTDGCAAYDGTPLSERLYDIYGGWWVVPYVFLFVSITLGLFNLIMAIFIDNVMASQMQRKLQEISNTAKSVEIDLKESLLRLTLQSKSNGVPPDVEKEIMHMDDHYHNHLARVRAKFDLLVSAEIVESGIFILVEGSWICGCTQGCRH